jgi:hypothetical protein
MSGNIWWIGPIVLVLLRLLYAEARNEKAFMKGEVLVFRAAVGVRALFAFGIIFFLVLLIRNIGREETWILIVGGITEILICFAWPSTITIESNAIARRLWWKPALSIPWPEVVHLERSKGGDWIVYSVDGKTIEFSRYHTDPCRFETEVNRRARFR